uniref:Putative secreted protein n=1 Tax=Anopheles darlingi TaxID=43151 RepID=A0A2M4DHJ7_ANODA
MPVLTITITITMITGTFLTPVSMIDRSRLAALAIPDPSIFQHRSLKRSRMERRTMRCLRFRLKQPKLLAGSYPC